MSIVLLLGGARAGKSDRAVALATERAGRVLFVATAEALDDEMAERIRTHRQSRPAEWDTIEIPRELAADLRQYLDAAVTPYTTIIVDCLTLWVSNVLLGLGDEADSHTEVARGIADTLDLASRTASTQWIFVSNEVGLGLVPDNALARTYRDALGRANQAVSAAADNVTLMIAGNSLRLK